MKRAPLLIFDCDGVLVDSEPIASRVFCEAIAALGVVSTPAEVDRKYRGRSLRDCVVLLEQETGASVPIDFLEDLSRRTRMAFDAELVAVPGVEHVIQWSKECALPRCVASSGSLEKIEHSLGLVGFLLDFRGALFSASQVARGKPAPDLFLFAARSMGHEPAHCAVIEDSLAGARAGLEAGMTVFAYRGVGDEQEGWTALFEQGVRPFAAMRELPKMLEEFAASR